MNELSADERNALRAVSEALVIIRKLAAQPMTAARQAAIHDLADAFHNIPEHLSGINGQREANSFLFNAGVAHAQRAHQRHGIHSQHLPPLPDATTTSTTVEAGKVEPSDLMAMIGRFPARMMPFFFKPTDRQ